MNKDKAIEAGLKAVVDTFVVTDVGSFDNVHEEENATIALVAEGPSEGPVIPQPADEEADIFYVTYGFNSVEGDGHFRCTARVTEEGARIVDFEALPE